MLTRVLTLALLGTALAVSAAASAAELGKLTVRSTQGQPLDAEIEIDARPAERAVSLAARLAPAEAYRGTGLDYDPVLQDVRATVERRGDGRFVIKLASQQPVDRPYLDMVVELATASGRVSRVYTFLLEPRARASTPSTTATDLKPGAAQEAREPAAPIAAAPMAPSSTRAGTHEVQRGDTLAAIARANLPHGVTLSQMLVALFRANEAAFIEKNMNLVRTGQTLTVPDPQVAAAVADAEAKSLILEHAREFDAYRKRLAEMVAAAPARADSGQRAAGRITAAEAPPAAPRTPPQDQLRLSRADAPGTGTSGTARSDNAAALDQAIKEARDRAVQLERNLNDMRRLLEMKNRLLAQLQEQAKAAKAAAAARARAPEASQVAARNVGARAEAEFKRTRPCPATGKPDEQCSGYAIVRIVPLCAGGADTPSNMQWQTVAAAKRKERADQERCARG